MPLSLPPRLTFRDAFTRDLSLTTGTLARTGYGFKPTWLMITGCIAAGPGTFTFLVDSTRLINGVVMYGNNVSANSANIYGPADGSASALQAVSIDSFDADGVT